MENFEEYLVCGDCRTYGYRKTYAEASALAIECKDAKIYGASWEKSKFAGLLHRVWVEVETDAKKERITMAIINCQICGCEMAWEKPDAPGHYIASSCYLDGDWPICHDCMADHCLHTNCLGCNYGKYPHCRFLEMKSHYMSKD